jgi:hypothetical protein
MKSANDTIGNRTRELPSCSAVSPASPRATQIKKPTHNLRRIRPNMQRDISCNRTVQAVKLAGHDNGFLKQDDRFS